VLYQGFVDDDGDADENKKLCCGVELCCIFVDDNGDADENRRLCCGIELVLYQGDWHL
jgi:hypothetical protein